MVTAPSDIICHVVQLGSDRETYNKRLVFAHGVPLGYIYWLDTKNGEHMAVAIVESLDGKRRHLSGKILITPDFVRELYVFVFGEFASTLTFRVVRVKPRLLESHIPYVRSTE